MPQCRYCRCFASGGSASPDVPYPEGSLNQQVKNLIQKLGEAIHESVSESEHIAGVVKNIREQGFDVLLMLEATIGLNELEMDEAESATPGEQAEEVEGPFTSSDLSFLKSLRISITEEDTEEVASDEPSE
ncbi:hypothetical protein SAMN05421771_0346 [Granulicella pectinivorans]|uniref:Uncharacterized protein n=1 Tax=Granulicella pectinivorans TaxID=474950 RepID=A0A1I6L7D3_9BACT|nr:hypothetical protein SAMN05421771_0346 [Granulicella pectinivorans]